MGEWRPEANVAKETTGGRPVVVLLVPNGQGQRGLHQPWEQAIRDRA